MLSPRKIGFRPRIGILLGSGIDIPEEKVSNPASIPYKELGLPMPTVPGHSDKVLTGFFSGVPVAIMKGRFHLYEGYSSKTTAKPIEVLGEFGIKTLIVTNASGSLKKGFKPETFLLVKDHINLMGENPLTGIKDRIGKRFLDLTKAYDPALIRLCEDVARKEKIIVRKGTITAVRGPCYETPSEVKMLSKLGGDAVCMSSLPEVIMARYLGMRVLAVSFITNYASGLSQKGPSHSEVIKTAEKMEENFIRLLEGVIPEIGRLSA